jgi:hypothetical protein
MQTTLDGVLAVVRGRYQVVAEPDTVSFRDGSRVGLHRVVAALGTDTCFLRAVQGSDHLWRVVDMREAVPNLLREYTLVDRQDRDFLLRFSVRTLFDDARAFVRWVEASDPIRRAA